MPAGRCFCVTASEHFTDTSHTAHVCVCVFVGGGGDLKLPLCLISTPLCHEDTWRNFITTLDGGEWSASRSCRFTRSTHWMGVWVGLRVSGRCGEENRTRSSGMGDTAR
jgi:hypothetical protein